VTVNAVAAGLVRTKMGMNLLDFVRAKEEDWARETTLTDKLIEPEEVAELVTYLSSDLARNITRQVFVIDAGFTIVSARKFSSGVAHQ